MIPNVGPYHEDSLTFRTFGGLPIFLRASDSALMRADTTLPVVGEIVQGWGANLRLLTSPATEFVTRLEIFREFR